MNRVYRVPNPDASNTQPPKLLDRLRQVLRTKHYAYRTEQAYVHWIVRFIRWHADIHKEWRHPAKTAE